MSWQFLRLLRFPLLGVMLCGLPVLTWGSETVTPVSSPTVASEALGSASESPTLAKIREYGIVYVGHREVSAPFSFMIGNEPAGFSWDLCMKVVGGLRERLQIPQLRVVPVPLSPISRFMSVMTTTSDMECGVTTNTKIRAQRVDFSVTFFVANLKVMVRKDSGIDSFKALNGRRIITTANTTAARYVSMASLQNKISPRSFVGRTTAETFERFFNKEVDAVAMDDILMIGRLASMPNRDDYQLLEENLSFEPYGLVLPKDDPEFKKMVDGVLIGMMKSGEFERLYNKWFMEPTPPSGGVLNWPVGDLLKELIAHPNDKGV